MKKFISTCFLFLMLIAVVVFLVTVFAPVGGQFLFFQPLEAYPGEETFVVGVSLLIIAMATVGAALPWVSALEKWGKIGMTVFCLFATVVGLFILKVGYPAMEEAFAVTRPVQIIFVVAIAFTVLCLICFFTGKNKRQNFWSFMSFLGAVFCILMECRAADGEYVSLKGFFWQISVCALVSFLAGCYCIWSKETDDKPKSNDKGSTGGGFASRVSSSEENVCFG